jgi:hypothetical protein
VGRISLGELLASAGVAAVISGIVALVVARWQASATIEAAQATIQAARVTTDAEVARQCRDALRRTVEALQIVGTTEVEWAVRQEQAGKALAGLIEVVAILGQPVRTTHFDQLIDALNARTEEGLVLANRLWPRVQIQIITVLAD